MAEEEIGERRSCCLDSVFLTECLTPVTARRPLLSPVVSIPVKRVRVSPAVPLAPAEAFSFEYAFGQTDLSEGWKERRRGLKDSIASMIVGLRPGGSMDAADWQAIGRAVGEVIDGVIAGGAEGGAAGKGVTGEGEGKGKGTEGGGIEGAEGPEGPEGNSK